MCERYSLQADKADLVGMFRIEKVHHCSTNRFNIAPLQTVTIVMNNRHGERVLQQSRWGLFPYWAKDSVNADGGSLARKPFFERMLKRQRCVIPCSGFYGWKPGEKVKSPRPMHIVMPGRPLFGMAGFYDQWRNADGEEVRAFTIVTVPAAGAISVWHDRFPVILDEEAADRWLDPSLTDFTLLRKFLEPVEASQLRAYPVSEAVADENYESPDCVREIRADFA